MAMETGDRVKIFYSYSPKDVELKKALESQLHHNHIVPLDDGLIRPGEMWKEEIEKYLDIADIILLLISPDFMASNYSYSQEMKRILERHEKKEAHVIPIILRPVEWESTPLGKLRALPREGRAVVMSKLRVQALYKIAREILAVADEILSQKCLNRAEAYKRDKQYEDALREYERAIHFNRKDSLPYQYKGDLLFFLKRFKEAFGSYDAALKIAPDNVQLLQSLGRTLVKLERYDDALVTYKDATELAPNNANLRIEMGDIYLELKRITEALTAYDQAIELESRTASFHMKRGDALLRNNRQEEALAAYDKAIYLDANNALFHSRKGDALCVVY